MSRNDELREQIRLMTVLCWRLLSVFGITLLIALLLCLCYDGCTGRGGSGADTLSVRVDSVRDIKINHVKDTAPVVRRETVVGRIPVLELLTQADDRVNDRVNDSVNDAFQSEPVRVSPMPDSLCDSPMLDIVQREYSDDSTYTAWVSGIRYGQYPKLDSITVCQREITTRVKETVTLQKRQSRWSVGLQAGYGYGFLHRGFEPYVGVGVAYRLFPP